MYREQYVLKRNITQNKYQFGNYVSQPASTYSFTIARTITTNKVPMECINKIFLYNNTGLNGISAVCTIIPFNSITVHHCWKIYADEQYAHVIRDVAQEINSCYGSN